MRTPLITSSLQQAKWFRASRHKKTTLQPYAWLLAVLCAWMVALPASAQAQQPPTLSSLLPSGFGVNDPLLWWGTLQVTGGGLDLMTVTITHQRGPGSDSPTPATGRQWTVFGTWSPVCSTGQNLVAGTIDSDGKTILVFSIPGTPLSDNQLTVGTVEAGTDGRLYGLVTVVQGPDLNNTFSFVLGHQ
jgi:hypothetical protein